jgi:DNA-binding XRE family transcriptional regulator
MNTDPSSSPLAFFAADVKRLRGIAGMTQEHLAKATAYSPASIAAIETCRLLPSLRFAQLADEAFRTDGHLERLQDLVDQTSVLPWFRDLIKVERKAIEIREYDSYVIPGLLQTERYARCCVSPTRPALTADEINRAVALRMTRQEILDRDEPPRLWFIIDESALYRANGGAEIMTEQLEHLVKLSERPEIVIQVIPNSAGSTAAGGRAFIILTFKSESTIVYLEDVKSARYVRKPDEVATYTLTFDHLRSRALPDDESRALIREAISRYAK